MGRLASIPDAATSPRRLVARRRARRALLSALTAFVAVQIAAAAVLELWFPGAIDPDYGARLQVIRAASHKNAQHPSTIIMLGSSRAYHGFVTRDLSDYLSAECSRPIRVVNAAYPGSGPVTELLTWKRLQRDRVRPDLLLVEVFPGFLTDGHATEELSEARMPMHRLSYLDLPLIERFRAGARPDLWPQAVCMEAAALYERRLGVVLSLAPRLLDPGANQLVVSPGPALLPADMPAEQRAKALELAHFDYSAALQHADPDSRNGQALSELLASCRQAGVPTMLVVMPEGPAFRSWYPPGTWARIATWLERISRDYDAPVVNAREWIDEDDFMDSHHLFPRGAEAFSSRLGRERLLPWLRGQSNESVLASPY